MTLKEQLRENAAALTLPELVAMVRATMDKSSAEQLRIAADLLDGKSAAEIKIAHTLVRNVDAILEGAKALAAARRAERKATP